MLDEANAYERGMDDDLTFQTVRELAGTAYMAGRSAPPTDAEVEAVAKRLCWNSSHGNVSTRDSGGWPTVSKSWNTTADTSLRIVRHSTISAVRNRRPTNATTTCFIPRRENGSGRLFETVTFSPAL